MDRRDFLKAGAALTAAGFPGASLLAAADVAAADVAEQWPHRGAPTPFDYASLKGQARALAAAAYQASPQQTLPELENLSWDRYQALRYRDDRALWRQEHLPFQARLFHVGRQFTHPVRIDEVINGQARELIYDPALFDYGSSGINAERLPRDLGFAGFRLNLQKDIARRVDADVVAFLGASYFRAVGSEYQYGVSARGLAINCGMPQPEEFPVFTRFWLERPAADAGRLVVYALLDSPSISGAYRFDIRPGEPLVMEVDAALYPRKPIERLGIAPLTSMFLRGENERHGTPDWRPEIHDSDGLSMWRGNGEWLWRPLVNPSTDVHVSAFQDEQPKGFGLMQRDRDFDHYQDDNFYYHRRPSLWVEPKSGWGKGSVQLLEIPTADETFDNIVAYWAPQATPQVGQEMLFSYRLYWGVRMPAESALAKVVATRTGAGGAVGVVKIERHYFSWRFVVDFAGGALAKLSRDSRVQAQVSASRGTIESVTAKPLEALHGYRAMFDLKPDAAAAPVDLRLTMTLDGKTLTETWLYQWTPPTDRSF
ncbi:glucan biosynthesis protein D [Herbaspirillum sp. RTI4]|nr:glucan biosynthesis protein D [Herbaspirillum sp. RTI4]MDY7578103.1 glucan biosynthesis protein D [Herbaspirillum sp. RTI4]MEA9980692.1 glucan biosynthesis protein D [Herbaspirillum sp. RTI4]